MPWCWASHAHATIPPAASPSPGRQDHPPELATMSAAHLSSSPTGHGMAALEASPGPLHGLLSLFTVRSARVKRGERPFPCARRVDALDPIASPVICSHSRLQTGSFTPSHEEAEDSWFPSNSFLPLSRELLPPRWISSFRSGSRHKQH